MPGAVRASAGINTSDEDVERFLEAVRRIASGAGPSYVYVQDGRTGDFLPDEKATPWYEGGRRRPAACAPG